MELLKEASAVELGSATNFSAMLLPVFVRGEAYLALGGGNRAETEFQKFIDHRGVVGNFPWGTLARLGLARAYAMQGDVAKARAVYQDFLSLWKDSFLKTWRSTHRRSNASGARQRPLLRSITPIAARFMTSMKRHSAQGATTGVRFRAAAIETR